MKNISLLILHGIICLFSLTAYGQSVTGNVEDIISLAPLEFVNVVGMGADSTFVAGTVTDSVGRFELPGKGIEMLTFRLVGYDEQTLAVGDNDRQSLIVRLSPKETLLQEVSVTARKPMTRLVEGDMVTSVGNTPLADMPTVFETLSFIPMLSVEGESVSVFGKGSPIFYINSRRVRDLSDLRALQPSDIASIKVITNPGSRYGADVNAVILIKTKKQAGEGLSGWISETMVLDPRFSNTIGTYLQYRWRGLELFGRIYQNHIDSETVMEYYSDVFSSIPRREDFSSRYIDLHNNVNGKVGFSYDFNANHSVGGSYYLLWSKTKRDLSSTTKQLTPDTTDEWEQNEEGDTRMWPCHNLNFYYEGKIGDLSVSSNFDYQGNDSRTDTRYHEFGGTTPSRFFSTQGTSSSRLLAENVILAYPVKNAEFSLGQEWTDTDYKSTFFSPEGVMNAGYSDNNESSIAVFASWKQRLSKFFWEIGLRYEHRRVKYYGSDDSYKENHDYLFPNIKFGATFGKFSWNIGYRYDTYQPSYSMMTGQVNYVNRYTYQAGNPQLRSSKLQRVYLNAQYGAFWLQSGYKYEKSAIIHASVLYEPDPEIILQYWMNIPDIKSMYVNAGYGTKIIRWTPSLSMGLEKQWLKVESGGRQVALSQPIFTVAFDNSIELPYGFTLYGQYVFRSSGDSRLSYIRYSHLLNIGLSKTFLKGMLAIQVWGRDLLDQQRLHYTSYDPATINKGMTDRSFRDFKLTVKYTFNATRSRYKGQGAGASEKNRL